MKGSHRTIDASKLTPTILKLNPGIQEELNRPIAAPVEPATAFLPEKWPVVAEKPIRDKKRSQAEWEYEAMLKREYPEAEILYERYTFTLANKLKYTPDYAVVWRWKDNGQDYSEVELHEVKGKYLFRGATASATRSSLTKPRTAAQMFPWHKFYIAQKIDGSWTRELCQTA